MINEPIDFLTKRKLHAMPTIEDRAALGKLLNDVAEGVVTNRLEIGNAYAVAVIVLTDNGPAVWVNGLREWDDCHDIIRAAHDFTAAKMGKAQGIEVDIQKAVSDGHRRHYAGIEAKKAVEAQFEHDNPWQCEYCNRRYKTERGAIQHERKCWKNPEAQQFRSGQYIPLQVRDGKAHGWSLANLNRP